MSSPQSHLLDILTSHNTNLTEDDVSWAFENPKTTAPVTDYISSYLTPATLLSHEELALYTHLRKTGAANKIHISPHQPPPLTEPYLRHETAALHTATALLQAQTATLLAQRTALENTRSRHRAERERRKKTEAARRKKWNANREDIEGLVSDLLGLLGEEVADLRATLSADNLAGDQQEVGRLLESDDRVLARLEGLAAGLVVPDEGGGEAAEAMQRAEGLVETLARLQEAEIHARLDRVYLEAAAKGGGERGGEEELKEEIDGLYTEIPTVAKGAAYNEFFHPLLQLLEKARDSRGENWAQGGEYICQILSHLANRNTAITELLTSSTSRDTAVLTLLATIARESHLTPPTARPSTPPPHPPTSRQSPTKLGRIPYLTPSRRRADLALSKTDYPELALLSHLGVSLPPPPPDSRVPHVTAGLLAEQIRRMTGKADSLAAGWEVGMSAGWEEARGEAWRVVGALEGELMSGAVAGGEGVGAMVRVPREVRRGVGEVERRVKEMGGVMGGLVKGVERLERAGGDVGGGKAGFVGRWER